MTVSFQFLHRIPLKAISVSRTSSHTSFNSFTGFHTIRVEGEANLRARLSIPSPDSTSDIRGPLGVSERLSIPSPDSTLIGREGERQAIDDFQFLHRIPQKLGSNISFRLPASDLFFQFLHRIPQVLAIIEDGATSSGSFNSFTGFHIKNMTMRIHDAMSFQFLHRIPLSDWGGSSSTTMMMTFNSFTGFHLRSSRRLVVQTHLSFQFLHRIPQQAKVLSTMRIIYYLSIPSPDSTILDEAAFIPVEVIFQFLHRIPPENLDAGVASWDPIFQFLHRIPHEAPLEGPRGKAEAFNSFTGFHHERLLVGVGIPCYHPFQFLHRIPLS